MNRNEFLVKTIRYCLLLLLSVIAMAAGRKAVSGTRCSSCPVRSTCSGEPDCTVSNNRK